jgi:hypothetical protein
VIGGLGSPLPWRIYTDIKNCLLSSDGVLFGGCVRDNILHDHSAINFYEKLTHLPYGDPNADIETINRLIIPRDIDVVFYKETDIDVFKAALGLKGYKVTHTNTVSQYPTIIPIGWLHNKLTIMFSLPDTLRTYSTGMPFFMVDVLYPDISNISYIDKLPPFGACDFECNGLVMFKKYGSEIIALGGDLNYDKTSAYSAYSSLSDVISDILDKRAIFCGDSTMSHRIKKMLGKGYTIASHAVSLLTRADLSDDDLCLICHESLDLETSVSLTCCKGKYHPACLSKVLRKFNNCPQCRSVFDICDVDRAFLVALL